MPLLPGSALRSQPRKIRHRYGSPSLNPQLLLLSAALMDRDVDKLIMANVRDPEHADYFDWLFLAKRGWITTQSYN